MFVLITDETNKEATQEVIYFIYGGIVVPADSISRIHEKVEAIRAKHKYPALTELKFSPNTRPKDFPMDAFNAMKAEVIAVALEEKVRFIAYLVPHAIAAGQGAKKTVEFGLNTVLAKFDEFLHEAPPDFGMVFIDNPEIETPFKYMSDKFLGGLTFPSGRKRLEKVCVLSIVGAGTTHLSSVMDIVLGTFRYCVNSSKETEVVKTCLPKLMMLMLGTVKERKKHILERGLIVRPKQMHAMYQEKVTALLERLIRIANENLPKKDGA